MNGLKNILNSFTATNLKEIDAVKLMDRVDSKFTFGTEILPQILKEIEPYYLCLEINNTKVSHYKNLYYDAADLLMYNQHHNNKLNRYKVRQRTYEESGQSYLEIKFKSNKGRTIKNRIETQNTAFPFEANNFEFLTTHLPFNPNILKPMAWINYSRITLISKQCSEKLTLDLDLEFKKDTESYNLTGLVIAEVKQTQPAPSHFLKVMKKLGLSADAMSKYCFAIAFTNREVKKNNFKEKLLALKQIIRHDADSNIYRNFKQQ